ncbi:serine aminopeptidase domain-containing protein [Bartonella sp. B30(2025)]
MKIPFHSINWSSLPCNLCNNHLKTGIDREIRFVTTRPTTDKPKGTIVILGNYTNTIEEYCLPMNEISKRGFYTAIFDWFDKAPPQHTIVKKRHYQYFDINNDINDLDKFLTNVVYNNCPPPYYLLTFGIGGLIAFNGLDIINHQFSKMLCVSPLFAPFGNKANSFQHKITQLFSDIGLGFLPMISVNKLKKKTTPFLRINKESLPPPPHLFIPSPTSRWMASVFNAIEIMKKNILNGHLQIATLFILANKNNMINNIEVRQLCQQTHITDSITIIGADLDTIMQEEHHKNQFWAAFDAFIPGSISIT